MKRKGEGLSNWEETWCWKSTQKSVSVRMRLFAVVRTRISEFGKACRQLKSSVMFFMPCFFTHSLLMFSSVLMHLCHKHVHISVNCF